MTNENRLNAEENNNEIAIDQSLESLVNAMVECNNSFFAVEQDRWSLIRALMKLNQVFNKKNSIINNLNTLMEKANLGDGLEGKLEENIQTIETLKITIEKEKQNKDEIEKQIQEIEQQKRALEHTINKKENVIKHREKEEKALKDKQSELLNLGSFDKSIIPELQSQIEEMRKAKPWLDKLSSLSQELEEKIPAFHKLTDDSLSFLKENSQKKLEAANKNLDNIQKEIENHRKRSSEIEEKEISLKEELEGTLQKYQEIEKRFQCINEEYKKHCTIDKKMAEMLGDNNAQAKNAIDMLDTFERELNSKITTIEQSVLKEAMEISEKKNNLN